MTFIGLGLVLCLLGPVPTGATSAGHEEEGEGNEKKNDILLSTSEKSPFGLKVSSNLQPDEA